MSSYDASINRKQQAAEQKCYPHLYEVRWKETTELIKELQTTVRALEDKVDDLQSTVDSLEKDVDNLKWKV